MQKFWLWECGLKSNARFQANREEEKISLESVKINGFVIQLLRNIHKFWIGSPLDLVERKRAHINVPSLWSVAGHLLRYRVFVALLLWPRASAHRCPQLLHDTELAFTPPSDSDAARPRARSSGASHPSAMLPTSNASLLRQLTNSGYHKVYGTPGLLLCAQRYAVQSLSERNIRIHELLHAR